MRISDWSSDVCSSDPKPVGVVGAVSPSTNPAATPVNKAMMAIKGRNAIIVAPSPSGYTTTAKTVDYMRQELARIGLPADLVQILPSRSEEHTSELQSLMRISYAVFCLKNKTNTLP